MTLREQLKQAERRAIEEVLVRTLGTGRMTRAAKALGISRKGLWERMKKLGIDKRLAHPQQHLGFELPPHNIDEAAA